MGGSSKNSAMSENPCTHIRPLGPGRSLFCPSNLFTGATMGKEKAKAIDERDKEGGLGIMFGGNCLVMIEKKDPFLAGISEC